MPRRLPSTRTNDVSKHRFTVDRASYIADVRVFPIPARIEGIAVTKSRIVEKFKVCVEITPNTSYLTIDYQIFQFESQHNLLFYAEMVENVC